MLRVTLVASGLMLAWCGLLAAQTSARPEPTQAAGLSASVGEAKPEASAEPGYASQSNGERARVQPGNNAPMWRQVGAGVTGSSSLPEREAPEVGVLIQPRVQYPGSRLTTAGEAWRQVRNHWLVPYGGALLLIVLAAMALFYWRVGPLRLHAKPTGRLIERFTPFERVAHWTNAAAFSLLAISGLVMAFGKFLLLPIMGTTLFGWVAYAMKNLHNFAGPLFAVSLLIVIVTFVRDNLPARGDLRWLLTGGGLWSGREVKSGRFNAGEKLVFWAGVLLLGLTVVASGLVMDKLVPGLAYERSTMQLAHMVHLVANLLMLALFIGHIYLGTIGTEGAYEGMRTGYVDETWAKEHHQGWLDDIDRGTIPAQRSPTPATDPWVAAPPATAADPARRS